MISKNRRIEDFAGNSVRALNMARKVFRSSVAINTWLNAPQAALGNQVPAILLSTARGAVWVIRELTRIRRFKEKAKVIAVRLERFEIERQQAALKAFSVLEKFDPEIAKLAVEAH